jgi:AcrR family transcriptional regulator
MKTKLASTSFDRLIDPSFDLVSKAGLGALTLRPLADATHISLSQLTSLVGRKSDLICGLIKAGRARDQILRQQILDLNSNLSQAAPDDIAELCDLTLDHWVQKDRAMAVFFCEILFASATDPALFIELAPWINDQLIFWKQLTEKLPWSDTGLPAEILLAYSIDELVHSCAHYMSADYHRLRRLCLQRLCRKQVAEHVPPDASEQIFRYLFDALGDLDDQIGIDKQIWAPKSDRARMIALTGARMIVDRGADAISHRSVAAEMGLPSSTLAYHFRTREDLLKGAMAGIIGQLKQSLSQGQLPDGQVAIMNAGYAIARSTYALALEAGRNPAFIASAADMRRKRGINLRVSFNRMGSAQTLDGLGAQVISIATIGQVLLSAHLGLPAAMQATGHLRDRFVTELGLMGGGP